MSESPLSRRHVADALRIHVDAVRGPEPAGSDRARLDERHRVALLHPEYDGFLVLHVTALGDLDDVRIRPDDQLARVFTPHHVIGPLRRGQVRSVDLEIHPKALGENPGRVTGLLHIVDGNDAAICPALRMTLGTDRSLECTLAGRIDGPWSDGDQFDAIAREFIDGAGDAQSFARRITLVEAGKADPGWPRKRRWFGR
jgi:hypothetical protein